MSGPPIPVESRRDPHWRSRLDRGGQFPRAMETAVGDQHHGCVGDAGQHAAGQRDRRFGPCGSRGSRQRAQRFPQHGGIVSQAASYADGVAGRKDRRGVAYSKAADDLQEAIGLIKASIASFRLKS